MQLQFVNNWLARYPRPVSLTFDQGSEFLGNPFFNMMNTYGIHPNPTATINLQANSVCERMHQTVGNILRAMSHSNPPPGTTSPEQMIDTAIAQAVYALRATTHCSRDMIFDLPLVADFEFIRQHRQALIDQRLVCLLYTSPSPRDGATSRMPSSA